MKVLLSLRLANIELLISDDTMAEEQQRWPLTRRKLNDVCVSSFLVGSTPARALPAPTADSSRLRVLYACSGDCRHALATAAAWDDVEITLNDANACVAVRNVVLLRLLRRGEAEAARQLWADAWLDEKSDALVTNELRAIALGLDGDDNVRVRKGAAIRRCAAAWLAAPGADAYARARAAAVAVDGAGGGSRVSDAWLAYGIVGPGGKQRRKRGRPNATLLDEGGAFRETQGPAHAFARLDGLAIESEAFLKVCGAYWAKLGALAAGATFIISCADALTRPPAFRRRRYDCVDASTACDDAGLWNVLLALAPCVAPGGRLLTAHALTGCASLDTLLGEEWPFDTWAQRKLLRAVGWAALPVEEEVGLRVAWARKAACLTPAPAARFRAKRMKRDGRAAFRRILGQLLVRTFPVPMDPELRVSTAAPVDAGFAFPKTTIATVVALVAAAGDAAAGALDAVLGEMAEHPVARNLAAQLLVELSLQSGWRRAAPRLAFARSLPPVRVVRWTVTAPPDLAAPRGGVHEPALGVLLLRDAATLEAARAADGAWEVDEDGARVNLLYEFCEGADGGALQVLDHVAFDVPSSTLELVLPGGLPFRHALLIDVQTFASIGQALDLDDGAA